MYIVIYYLLLLEPFAFPPDQDPPPVVEWLIATEQDLGDISQHSITRVAFDFKNISSAPIIIDNVRTSCGCTAPDWTEAPILPDSVATINIDYDATKQGYFRKWIRVFFNSQRKAERLYIEGYVVKE